MNKEGFFLVDALLIIIITVLVVMLIALALPLERKEKNLRKQYYNQLILPPC